MESSAQEIHENLNSVVDYQTHHRLRETQVSSFIHGHLQYQDSQLGFNFPKFRSYDT